MAGKHSISITDVYVTSLHFTLLTSSSQKNLDAQVARPKDSTPKIETSMKTLRRRKARAEEQKQKSQSQKMKITKLFAAYAVSMKRKKTPREI
jgi:predicted RNA-binding protein with RPS1 domain